MTPPKQSKKLREQGEPTYEVEMFMQGAYGVMEHYDRQKLLRRLKMESIEKSAGD